ncbi:Xanthine/uracil permease [Bordetella ansorpii]|uniref:Xanthine/uracil permease n=1 Tax=Bordetella ansorpii TaxID=288768 RepID=A0A157SMT4_9BORD|nr:solute carrier family 23 protein [Bordetella ansorpii]SAI71624.1 Xanthine/uracil permease [Bordetella ansorpii]
MPLLSRLRLPPSSPLRRRPPDLVYAADERPGAGALLGLALQHAATALGLIAYVLASARIAGLSVQDTSSLVTATVLGMGLATFLQAWGSRTGAGALIVHMPDAIIVMIAGTLLVQYGPGGLVLAGIVNGLVGLFIGQVIPRLRALFPPTVAGVVVCVTGLSLIAPALQHTAGLTDNELDGGSLLVGGVTLAAIVVLSVWGTRRMKLFALLAGVLGGVALSGALGQLHGGEELAAAPLFALPSLVTPVLGVDPGLLVAVALLSVMVQLDTLGTAVLLDKMDDADWRRADMRMVGRGMRAGSLANIAAGFFGGYPSVTSSANIALAHISRSTSRYVGLAAGALLALAALVPKSMLALTLIPTPVIGAVEIYAAAYLVVSGVELIASRAIDARGTFMVGLSFVAGVGVMLVPGLPGHFPASMRFLVESGVIVSGLTAIMLNLVFRLGTSRRAERDLAALPDDTARHVPRPAAGGLAGALVDFVETQGAAWGARRDVVRRAAAAALEAAEAIAAAGGDRHVTRIRGSFDEYNLDIELLHSGAPLQLAGHAPAPADLLDQDDDAFEAALDRVLPGVSAVLLQRLADRLSAGQRNGQAVFRLHFDH